MLQPRCIPPVAPQLEATLGGIVVIVGDLGVTFVVMSAVKLKDLLVSDAELQNVTSVGAATVTLGRLQFCCRQRTPANSRQRRQYEPG